MGGWGWLTAILDSVLSFFGKRIDRQEKAIDAKDDGTAGPVADGIRARMRRILNQRKGRIRPRRLDPGWEASPDPEDD